MLTKKKNNNKNSYTPIPSLKIYTCNSITNDDSYVHYVYVNICLSSKKMEEKKYIL